MLMAKRSSTAVDAPQTVGLSVGWSELLSQAVARLEQAGIATAQMDARRVVEELSGVRVSEIHQLRNDLVSHNAMAAFERMLSRRVKGEPLQYVLGRWGFRTLDLMVDQRVLIPRPETEMVAGLAIDAAKAVGGAKGVGAAKAVDAATQDLVTVADLGTGSGAIALSIAVECSRVRVFATDLSQDALAVARGNLAGIGNAATAVSLHHGDWFAALPEEVRGRLDVVVANPPYVAHSEQLPAVVADWEPPSALRAASDGLSELHKIVIEAPRWLAPNGVVVLEMAPTQSSTVCQWWRALGWSAEVHRDLNGRDRAVVARR